MEKEGDLPNSGIKLVSPTMQADSSLSEPPENPWCSGVLYNRWCVIFVCAHFDVSSFTVSTFPPPNNSLCLFNHSEFYSLSEFDSEEGTELITYMFIWSEVLGRKVLTNLDSILKSRDITLPTKVRLVKAMVFPVVMWELGHKESWVWNNWCFWTVVLEKTLESPLDCKEIQPIHPKGNQSWIFIGRTDAEAETPILWPPDVKNWLIGKDTDAGKDWRQEEKGMTEDEMVE